MADGTSPPAVEDGYSDYVPSATPGCRAPHVWLGSHDTALSTLDLFGAAFTLLAAPAGGAWRSAAADASRELGVRIDGYTIGGTGLVEGGRFAPAYVLEDDGAVLVRPDGHVAWRSARGPASRDALGAALARILGR